MSETKKIWDTEFLPKIEQTFELYKDKLVKENDIALNEEAMNNLAIADKNYKVKHNEFTYALWWILTVISCILIIPAYWVIKKVKVLKANKKALLDDIASKENEVKIVHEKIAYKFDTYNLSKALKPILDYENMGPVTESLIDSIQSISLFNLNGTANTNTYKTSWGVYDNKILLHVQEQEHVSFMKTYTGSISVSYRHSENDYGVDVVTAEIVRPAHRIDDKRWTYALMSGCSNLEFHLEGKKSKFGDRKFNKSHNYSALENPIFEEKTKWIRNDDAQFRMIFTPFTQETFVNETNNCKDIPAQWEWSKVKTFLTNEYDTDAHSLGLIHYINKSLSSFQSQPRMKLEVFYDSVKKEITNYFHELYNSMNYLWATTIMPSENHNFIIKKILDGKKIGNKSLSVLSHSVMQTLHPTAYVIPKANMATFPKYNSAVSKKISGVDFYTSDFDTLSYKIEHRVTYVSKYAYAARRHVSVPVEYDEYIPLSSSANLTVGYIPSKFIHYRSASRLISNITNGKLIQLLDSNGIQYANNYLSFNTNSNVNESILKEIIKLINDANQNSNINSNN